MSNEIRVTASVNINNGNLQHQSKPTSFFHDQTTGRGPTPGLIIATTLGTLIDLSKLTTPGVGTIQNLDTVSIVEFGLYIPSLNEFFPMLEIFPGKIWPVYLSQYLGQEFGTSTSGTSPGGASSQLMVRGVSNNCNVQANIFDR